MNEFVYRLIGSFLAIAIIYNIFFGEFQQYECDEIIGSSYDPYVTGLKVYLYRGGGVLSIDDERKSKFKRRHKIIEGTDFISYLRSSEKTAYKLDKRDLTYSSPLVGGKGQCTKVGIIKKLERGSFSSEDAKEYDY